SRSLDENPWPRSAVVHSRASSWTSRSRSVASRRARFTSSGSLGGIPLLLHDAPHGVHEVRLPAGRRDTWVVGIRPQLARLAQAEGAHLAVDLEIRGLAVRPHEDGEGDDRLALQPPCG